MKNKIKFISIKVAVFLLMYSACVSPNVIPRKVNIMQPSSFAKTTDSLNIAKIKAKDFFQDDNLMALIDTALKNNQELNIVLQEINISKNEIQARKGEYLPFLNVGAGAGVEKVGRYTSQGASDANNDIALNKKFPEPLTDLALGANISWELDIWKKLRNAKKSAVMRYLSSVDGKNFMITNLVAEIASSYYELMALDNQLILVKNNIELQQNALDMAKLQQNFAQTTSLAVLRFEAEVFKNKSHVFFIEQQIIETENKINFLVGRFPQKVMRNSQILNNFQIDTLQTGLPSQLLDNRPDIRQAERELVASKIDVKVARAAFYPALSIRAGVGLNAFNLAYFIQTPESLLFNLVGDMVAPLINRNAIKATYNSANSKQVQAIYNYEKTILNAHIEVVNQLSKIDNLKKSYDFKNQQVKALTNSIDVSLLLFKAARADYMDVLLTQRDALDAKFDLVEIKMQELLAKISVYRAVGGGWQ